MNSSMASKQFMEWIPKLKELLKNGREQAAYYLIKDDDLYKVIDADVLKHNESVYGQGVKKCKEYEASQDCEFIEDMKGQWYNLKILTEMKRKKIQLIERVKKEKENFKIVYEKKLGHKEEDT